MSSSTTERCGMNRAEFSIRVNAIVGDTEVTSAADVAALLITTLTPDDAMAILQWSLTGLVGDVWRVARQSVAPAGSSKASRVANWYEKYLDLHLHVSDDPSAVKRIADCTIDDLMFAVREREDIAARNLMQADEFRRVAEVMRSFHAETVADLPRDVLENVRALSVRAA